MTRPTAWRIVAAAGLAAAVLGTGLGALVAALLPLMGVAPRGPALLAASGLAALGLGLGGAVAYQAWLGSRGRPSRPFAPRSVWWLALLLGLSIGAGWLVAPLPGLGVTVLPALHIVGMALPPIVLLALTGRALRGVGGSWREVVVSLGSGGLLGSALTLAFEAALLLALAAAAAVVIVAVPGGTEWASVLSEQLGDPAGIQDGSAVLEILLNPIVALSVVAVVAVVVPLVEEAIKTLGVGVAGAWLRPRPARAFLWGVASGAGFAIAENLLNGAILGSSMWGPGALSRAAATALHCFTGGLVGWGWGQLWSGRRVRRFVASLVGAVLLHGLWNAIAAVVFGLGILAGAGRSGVGPVLSGAGAAALLGLLGVLAVALAVALPLIGRRLAESEMTVKSAVGAQGDVTEGAGRPVLRQGEASPESSGPYWDAPTVER